MPRGREIATYIAAEQAAVFVWRGSRPTSRNPRSPHSGFLDGFPTNRDAVYQDEINICILFSTGVHIVRECGSEGVYHPERRGDDGLRRTPVDTGFLLPQRNVYLILQPVFHNI